MSWHFFFMWFFAINGFAGGFTINGKSYNPNRVDVVARLTSRTFGGYESLQLEIRDVAAAGLHPEVAAFGGIALQLTGGEPALAAMGAAQ